MEYSRFGYDSKGSDFRKSYHFVSKENKAVSSLVFCYPGWDSNRRM